MTVDLRDDLRAALADPHLLDALADRLAARVVSQLAERDADRLLDSTEVAHRLGLTPAALRQRVARGSEIAQLAVVVDGRRRWRASSIERLIAGDAASTARPR